MERTTLASRRLLVGGLVLATYLAGVAALDLAKHTGTTAAWWPAAGIGVIAVLVAPRRQWPPVLAALGFVLSLANYTAGRSIGVSLLFGVADVAETWLVAALVVRYIGPRMTDLIDVWRLFAIAAAGAVVAALGLATGYAALLDQPFWRNFSTILPSHGASLMLLVPLALVRWRRARTEPPTRTVELAAQVSVLVATTLVTFGEAGVALGFTPLPVIVWAAVRFAPAVVVLELCVYASALSLLTQLGRGPFSLSAADPGQSTQQAQLYLICLVLVGLPLVQAMRQHDAALSRLRASERTFRRNFSESRLPIALVAVADAKATFTECNDALARVLGRSPEDLVGRRIDDFLSSSSLMTGLASATAGRTGDWFGPVGVAENARIRLDGTLSLLERTDEGAGFSLHMVDVTEPLELQERLQAERDYTRSVIDVASSMIVLTDEQGTVMAANPATSTLTGYSEEELLGRPLWELVIAEHQRVAVAGLFADRRLPRSGEAQLRTRSGDHLAVLFSSEAHRASADAPVTIVVSATDVTAARQNAGMLEHLLRSARTIAFVGTDLQGRITLFNTGAEHMLGIDADSATGRHLVEFIAEEDLARYAGRDPVGSSFEAIVDQAAGDLSPETRDWTWLPAGRPALKVSMTTNAVTDTFGDIIGYLFVASDITDTLRSQEIVVKALRREREVVTRLKDLDRAKDDFVSTVSHELRTPMSSIIGSAEMLADGMLGDLRPDQQRMVEVISRNGDRLLALADDLLHLATSDQNSWPEQHVGVDLRTVVEESASSVASMLAGRSLDVGYSQPDRPVLVSGDPSHLERAVTNLLTNAVKFTPDGGHVHLAVESEPTSQAAVIRVTDTGLGIPESDLEHVFGRFFRSALVQEKAIQGSGLGLSIVKTIVESHDGRIDVRSEPGEGTTFTITLPLARTAALDVRAGAGA